MNNNPDLPNPSRVLKLRIHLAWNQAITWQQLFSIADYDLTCYLINQPGFPERDLSEEHGLYWNCRKLRDWMQAHKVLQSAYTEGKKLVNPSGRAYEQEV
jgi:hypothetical protein